MPRKDSTTVTEVPKEPKVTKPRTKRPAIPKTEAEQAGIRSVQDVANEILNTVRESVTVAKKPRKPRAPLTDEQKQVLRDRLVKAREAKIAKRNI